MKRRDFITLIGGATVWSVGALAQQAQPKRRIGVLSGFARQDPESNARVVAFRQALADLGWSEERNLQIDYRWTEGDIDRVRALAAELVALAPDVILSEGSLSIGPLLRATRTIPIVFVNVVDPVGSGYVASLSRPGGNATGFNQFEYRVSGKWLELLKEIRSQMNKYADKFVHKDDSGYELKPKFLLTIASPAGEKNYRNLPLREISEVTDFINLMVSMLFPGRKGT